MKNKSSNFELLRIISMFLIVLHHFSVHTSWEFSAGLSLTKFSAQLLSIGGKVGVNCFILISGYFLSKSTFKLYSLLRVWTLTLFYSVGIYVLFFLLGTNYPSFSILLRSLFPVLLSTYWFITAYILIYISVPILNILTNTLSKSLYQKVLLIYFILFSILENFTRTDILNNGLLWFIFLYLLGGYISLYPIQLFSKSKLILMIVLSILSNLFTIALLDIFGKKIPELVNKEVFIFSNTQGIFPLITAFAVFLLIKELNIKSNYIINKIASTTFAVYLIHEHPLMREFLWKNIFTFVDIDSSSSIIFIGIFSSIFIFISASLFDILRQYLYLKVVKIQFVKRNITRIKEEKKWLKYVKL